jgi:hypothetical protein
MIQERIQTRTRISAKRLSDPAKAGCIGNGAACCCLEGIVMTTSNKNKSFVTLRDAVELMRNGQSLVLMHCRGGQAWYIAPRGGEVATETARALLARNDVQPGGDGLGLFKGCDQTYRFKL